MGSTNKTTNYELSQFLGSDKPAWLLDYNGDMLKIDTQMKANADAASAAQSKADAADGKADDLGIGLTTLNNQVNGPTGLADDVATLSGTMNTVTSLIGNGEPTTTDKTLIGAINELNADNGDMSTLTTTDKTSLVAAINEINGEVNKGTITVSGDGVKTLSEILDALYALIDRTKIDVNSLIVVSTSSTYKLIYHIVNFDNTDIIATRVQMSGQSTITSQFNLKTSSSIAKGVTIDASDSSISFNDDSSTVVSSGTNYTVIY